MQEYAPASLRVAMCTSCLHSLLSMRTGSWSHEIRLCKAQRGLTGSNYQRGSHLPGQCTDSCHMKRNTQCQSFRNE